jgi:hypothetical protein
MEFWRSKCALTSTQNFVFECQHDRLRALAGARCIFEPPKTLKKRFFVFSRYSQCVCGQTINIFFLLTRVVVLLIDTCHFRLLILNIQVFIANDNMTTVPVDNSPVACSLGLLLP